MENVSKWVAYFLILLMFSCKFSPSFIPETYVEPPSESESMISFELLPSVDTIKLFETITLKYNINTFNKDLYRVEFYLNSDLLEAQEFFNTQPYEFQFNTDNYNEGIYKFTIMVYTNTNTGSLADKIGAAGLMYELNWPLIIDKTAPRKLKFLSIDSTDSGAKISWEKFNHSSFEYYKLSRFSYAYAGVIDLTQINNPEQNYFLDTSYMEGMQVTYELSLNGLYTEKINYAQTPHKPKINKIGDFEVELAWDAPRNINLLDYYYIYTNKATVSMIESNKIYDYNSRTKNTIIAFDKPQYFGLLYAPKMESYLYPSNLLRGEIEYVLGDEMPTYKYARAINSDSDILLSNNGEIYKYNLLNGQISDSIQFNSEIADYFSTSEDGDCFGYSENGRFIYRNTADFSLKFSLPNTEYADNSGNLYMFRTSNTNRLLTVLKDNTLSVFDLETNTKIAGKTLPNLSWITARISPDGNFILTKEHDSQTHIVYYQIVGDQIIEIGRADDADLLNGSNIRNPFGPNQDIYIIYPEKIEIRNGTDFSVKELLPLGRVERIDYRTMRAVGSSIDFPGSISAYLYDLQTGNTIKNLYVKYSIYIYFYNNYLISNSGRKLNLEQ